MADEYAERTAIARNVRYGNHAKADELRAIYQTGRLKRHIEKVLATCPPLNAEQVETLRGLFPMPTSDTEGAA